MQLNPKFKFITHSLKLSFQRFSFCVCLEFISLLIQLCYWYNAAKQQAKAKNFEIMSLF